MIRVVLLGWLAAILCGCSKPAGEAPPAVSHQRIVTLAPNLTEMVFAVGAGAKLVGVSAWSDYPQAALELPVVGNAFSIDQERLALLKPDLLLVWDSGTPLHTVDKLRQSGYRVEAIKTRGLADISAAMRRIGQLPGRESAAEIAAQDFAAALRKLKLSHSAAAPIDVFFQVSARPLYTINRQHYVSELIEVCGGRNVFADLGGLAPAVSAESIVDRDPEVMLASSDAGDDAFDQWQRWPELRANRYRNLFLLPADHIARATPRLILAGDAMCTALEQARRNRAAADAEKARS